jgi:putative transposase
MLKTCTVVREPDGKWFASLVFEEVVPLQNTGIQTDFSANAPIGVDLGILSLIATSDGEKVEHPRFLRKTEKRLKGLQKALSHRKKGSRNRDKARRRVASQHCRVKRQRLDFNHKLSTRLVREHGFIAFEDLRTKNMIKNSKLAKSICDAAWGQLVRLTECKALRAGSTVVRVPAVYSTQECSYCRMLNKVNLDIRTFECLGCQRLLDRDTNAARVILKRGLAIVSMACARVGRGMPELRPVETRSYSSGQPEGQARSRKQELNASERGLETHGVNRGRTSLRCRSLWD